MHGCYGCSTGFKCMAEISLSKPDKVSLHFDSDSHFVILDQTGYNVQKMSDFQVLEVKGSTAVKNVNTTICITESRNKAMSIPRKICSKISLDLDEPEHRLIKRETLINLKPTDSSAPVCGGWGFFSCTWSNLMNFGKNIWYWISSGFGWVRIFLFVCLGLVLTGILVKIVLCMCAIRKQTKPSKVLTPKQMSALSCKAKKMYGNENRTASMGSRFRKFLGGSVNIDEEIPLMSLDKEN